MNKLFKIICIAGLCLTIAQNDLMGSEHSCDAAEVMAQVFFERQILQNQSINQAKFLEYQKLKSAAEETTQLASKKEAYIKFLQHLLTWEDVIKSVKGFSTHKVCLESFITRQQEQSSTSGFWVGSNSPPVESTTADERQNARSFGVYVPPSVTRSTLLTADESPRSPSASEVSSPYSSTETQNHLSKYRRCVAGAFIVALSAVGSGVAAGVSGFKLVKQYLKNAKEKDRKPSARGFFAYVNKRTGRRGLMAGFGITALGAALLAGGVFTFVILAARYTQASSNCGG